MTRDVISEVHKFTESLCQAYQDYGVEDSEAPLLVDIRVGQFLSDLLYLNGLDEKSLYYLETKDLVNMIQRYPKAYLNT